MGVGEDERLLPTLALSGETPDRLTHSSVLSLTAGLTVLRPDLPQPELEKVGKLVPEFGVAAADQSKYWSWIAWSSYV
jgi:hypothetical protein